MMHKLRRFFQSLKGRIFASHLLVLFTGMSALIIGLNLVAPAFFAQHMRFMMRGPGLRRMLEQGGLTAPYMRGTSPLSATELDSALAEALTAAFLSAMRSALWISAALGISVALIASIYISSRMARRMRAISQAARRISEGHFEERLDESGHDELAELALDFNRMASSLDHAEERRLQLLGDVAHELRNPLATVEGYMEGFIDGVVAPSEENFRLVQKESARLRRLVSDLQELSRAEAGAITVELEALHPAQCIEQVVARVEPLFLEKGVALSYHCPPDLLPVRADADRTLQILLNLLTNALHYTPAGGHVELTVTVQGAKACFCVKDTGIGIDAADLPHIFDRFYRADRSRSRSSGGTGLGLTIARYLVQAQRGQIWAESAGKGQGSTFCFSLPLWQNSEEMM